MTIVQLTAVIVLLGCTLSACWGDAPPPADLPVGTFPHTIPPAANDAVELEGEGARLYEVVGVTWPSSCSVYGDDQGCTAAEVRGYRILVERKGWMIEYRSVRGGGHPIRAGVLGEAKYYYDED